MLEKITKFAEKNFGILLLIGSIISFFIPQYFDWGKDSTDKLLMIGLFLGYLKIDFKEIFHLKNNIGKMLIFVSTSLIIMPLIFYFISPGLNPDLRMGIFLLLGVSGAVMTPFLASMLNLKILWAAVFVILTSFLSPFTLPFLVKTVFYLNINLSLLDMSLFLSKLIFIPSILAIICRKFLPKVTKESIKYSGLLGTLIMILFIGFLVAGNQKFLADNIFKPEILPTIGLLFLLFLTRFIIGFYMPHNNSEERWTNSLMFGNMNNGLVILLAAQFFSQGVLLVTLLSEIPWILAQPIFQKIFQHYYKKSSAK